MKIVGDIKDYYDGLISMYQEDSYQLWIRKTSSVIEKCPVNFYHNYSFFTQKTEPFVQSAGIIVFCGKGYPYFEVVEDGSVKIINTIDAITDIVDSHHKNSKNKWFINRNSIKSDFDIFFNESYNYNWDELHRKYNTPVMLFKAPIRPYYGKRIEEKKNLVINPILRDYEFMYIKDPYTAIQEIDMFIGNQLARKRYSNCS